MFTQNNSLPAHADRQQYQFIHINANMPPYRPNITAPSPAVAPFMNYICGALAHNVQQRAGENPLRMFLFNMCAKDNFANQYFDSLATHTIRLASYLMAAQNMNGNQAAEMAAENMCLYYAAANVRSFGALANLITDQGIRNEIQATINEYDTVINTLDNFGSNVPSGSNAWGSSAGAFSGSGSNSSFSAGFSTGTSLTTTSNFSTTTPAATTGGGFSQWGSSMDQGAAQPVVEVQQEVAVDTTATLPAYTSNWKPDMMEPYFYAYDPRRWDATLGLNDNGTTYPIYNPKSESQMEYDKHATPSVLGKLPEFLDLSQSAKTMERIAGGISKLNDEALQIDEGDVTTIKTAVSDEWLFATSESSAWLAASLKRLRLTPGDDGLPDVYRVYVRVADAIITENADENDVLATLVKCKSFVGLREKISALGGEMSTALFNVINQRLTDLVNRKIQMELGLKKLSIGSFYEDIGEIIDYLKQKYGEVMKSAFLSDQVENIQATLQLLPPEEQTGQAMIITAGMTFPDDVKPHITFVSSNYSLTYLDCLSWELNVEFSNDIPVKLSTEVTPVFYELVKGAFMDAENQSSVDRGNAIARIMMRTKDGREFECTKGTLADEAYLITLIK